jgi:hypothetical protein
MSLKRKNVKPRTCFPNLKKSIIRHKCLSSVQCSFSIFEGAGEYKLTGPAPLLVSRDRMPAHTTRLATKERFSLPDVLGSSDAENYEEDEDDEFDMEEPLTSKKQRRQKENADFQKVSKVFKARFNKEL